MYLGFATTQAFYPRQHQPVRQRFREYYRDLHARYDMPVDDAMLTQVGGYGFHELCYPLFDQLQQQAQSEALGLVVAAFWSYEFDPEYACYMPHLAEKYQMNCQMLDVSGQGSVCLLTALLVAHQHVEVTGETVAVMGFEQQGILVDDAKTAVMPAQSGSALVLLQKSPVVGLQILAVKIWTEQQFAAQGFDMFANILQQLAQFNIDMAQCVIACSRLGVAHRALNLYRERAAIFAKDIHFHFYPRGNSSLHMIKQLCALYANEWQPEQRYVVFIDEDVESFTTGMMILEVSCERT